MILKLIYIYILIPYYTYSDLKTHWNLNVDQTAFEMHLNDMLQMFECFYLAVAVQQNIIP